MVHDDLRVEWILQRVIAGFDLYDRPECLEELLNRGDGQEEEKMIRYLNLVSEEESPSCLLFFKAIREEEIEVKIPVEKTKDEDVSDPESKTWSRSEAEITSTAEDAEEEEEEEEESCYRTEVQVVYHLELHVAVNSYPERFLKSTVFYFIRNTKETIVEPLDMTEANILMPRLFDIGMHSGHPLLVLQNKLANVYLPMLMMHQMKVTGAGYQSQAASPQQNSVEGADKSPVKSTIRIPIRDELLNRTHKYLGLINTSLQHLQIQDDFTLDIPELELKPEVDVLLSTNAEMIETLEQCVMNWQTQITVFIEEQQNKKPQAPGPMAEIAFWQERASILCALSEQLKEPMVKKIMLEMTKADAAIVQTLEGTVAELNKYRVESDDNLRFLSTLERHFMNLATGSHFGVILETIPPLMDSLQIVWIISRHYNTNERMLPLMERIAWQLCERVSQVVDVSTIFKEKREMAKSMARDAKQVLDQWKTSYFVVRAEIEESGRGARWEFDRKRLFERTDYMASICQDLYNVLQVLVEFYNIFGPELKGVTRDQKRIDEVLHRVDALVLPIEEVRFNPFDMSNKSSWKTIMRDFDSTAQAIEAEAIGGQHY
ncbi:dynein heavy chain 10, axonemal-like [Cynoglossus semilaevis]|uniref:dynein heavy chain 10, axonemal-like n=1 Tax=Cynoglossus semilaevis TaxID=244447 RepID=UPI000D6291FA|nr:dynein heavy chain 10, axonemal-like [Cynoglossus semilaevis]